MSGSRRVPGFDGARLRAARRGAGLTQAELGARLGVDNSRIAHWEAGERTPSIGVLADLATALSVSPAALLTPAAADPSEVTLAQLRVSRGRSQVGLARAAGLARATLGALERGRIRSLSEPTAAALAAALAVEDAVVRRAHAAGLRARRQADIGPDP